MSSQTASEPWRLRQKPGREVEVVVFDAYGTLLDVHSAVARHAARLGEAAEAVSREWRQKQLEYAWVRSLTGPSRHRDFWTCTADALRFVCARHGIADEGLFADLLDAYRLLSPYPEVPAMLRAVRARGVQTAVLSNGSPMMLADAFGNAGLSTQIDALLSVEAVGVFKPDARVYALAERRLGLPARRMMFVSANPWDSQAAHAAGFRCVRVNRMAAPDEYGLADLGVPSLPDLTSLPELLN
ncbi:haloacid dehalogenase type II [Roseococcus sp. SYP-B2431]|uniref:haloacid dehalogenase type II n=1 Tax=Roseococcus sp. SYP-B2431 TaxID=2496640 RepID=UPI00103E95DA|nr:haloacid dehalogenase type II [Roseococcus sp. SYP-B2431]TCI00144.1 haloacid dehalogenase type II [Roseococcus sp. SYP-B2431]